MRRLIPIRQFPLPPVALGAMSAVTLSAVAASSTSINLTATYSGPPPAASYTFWQWDAQRLGWTPLVTQAGNTYVVNGLTGNTSYQFMVQANSNESPSRASMSAFANATTSGGVRKWNPGHYLASNSMGYLGDLTQRANRHADADKLVDGLISPAPKGIKFIYPWGSLEGAQGSFTFSEVLNDLAYVKALGKRMIIEIWWQQFGTGSLAPNTLFFPSYIYNAGGVIRNSAGTNLIDLSQSQWANRYVALVQALAAQATPGGFTIDTDPGIEQFHITELSGMGCSQVIPIILPGVAAAFAQTTYVCYGNYFDIVPASNFGVACATNKCGIGGPDMISVSGFGYEDFGSRVLRGAGNSPYQYTPGDGGSVTCGSVDYRGQVPVGYSYESLFNVPVSDVIGYAISTLKVTHPCWTVSSGGAAGTNYSDGIVPQLNANPNVGSVSYPTLL